jgi:hypothetical protein
MGAGGPSFANIVLDEKSSVEAYYSLYHFATFLSLSLSTYAVKLKHIGFNSCWEWPWLKV